jgi:amino acid transporter
VLVFITSLLMIGLLIPYDEPDLLNGTGNAASPFVLVFKRANVSGLDSLINVVICISVISVGMSSVYGGSRTLTALAEDGYAPRFFTYVDKSGRPLWSVLSVILFGPIAYASIDDNAGPQVFNWLGAS